MEDAGRAAADPPATNEEGYDNPRRRRRRLANRARHRLLSIGRDASDLERRVRDIVFRDCGQEYSAVRAVLYGGSPWLPNRHCGSWYLPPHDVVDAKTEVYFKSTDGHVGTYDFSLKRLNLQLLEVLNKHGGCFLVDSSARKVLPDSFSRTIPIWCSVINGIARRYRQELGLDDGSDGSCTDGEWDTGLHTPCCIVSEEEHREISNLIDSRVEMLHRSKAIVDPRRLVEVMTRPVRAIWVANGSVQGDTNTSCSSKYDPEKYLTIVCCNPSWYPDEEGASNVRWMPDEDYYYTPGAADDHSGWGRGLTSEVFWANRERILDPKLTEDGADAIIDSVVNEWRMRQNCGIDESKSTSLNVDRIGNMNLWIGSRRAGRPPECWDQFDAILNVTENEYPDMIQSITDRKENVHKTCHYLQLPVAEGKRDRYGLESWMPVGLSFLITHLQRERRVLVHCAQGRDRSVGVVLAFAALVCVPEYPLRLRPEFEVLDVDRMVDFSERRNSDDDDDDDEGSNLHLHSGLSSTLVKILVQEDGREVFLRWMHSQLNVPLEPFADKESIRIILHLVRQDRENAEPTRSTMQKLNRFLQSSPLYRPIEQKIATA